MTKDNEHSPANHHRATHKKIADKLGVERSNVTRAIGRLEEWHMIQRVNSGLIFVNPVLGFEGNGDVQREILNALRDKKTGKLPGRRLPRPQRPTATAQRPAGARCRRWGR
jgi:DNA-binding GntR family transcriptional regulator